MNKLFLMIGSVVAGAVVYVSAQTTQPAAPAVPSANQMLDQLLQPAATQPVRPLQPAPQAVPDVDRSTGANAVAPGAANMPLLREGSYVVDRTGRLTKAGEGWEFNFDADGKAMTDPPLKVLPNLKLVLMEDQLKATSRDLRFRITGQLTEYRGRNYVMIDKVVVLNN